MAGYLAEPGEAGALPPLAGGVPWLGRPDAAAAVVERYRISQVVFGAVPRPGDAQWLVLGALRRMRVRLRWLGDGVWLPAAAARSESFGGAPSAVQMAWGRRFAAAALGRTAGVLAGLLLALLAALPWLWLRLGPLRRGQALRRTVGVGDAWGHALELTLVTAADGRVRPLAWQWPLVGPLLAGRLGVWGGRAVAGAAPAPPADADAVIAFWRDEPAPPGLTGPWAATGRGDGQPAGAWARMWRDPCGFGNLGGGSGQDPGAAPTGGSRQREG